MISSLSDTIDFLVEKIYNQYKDNPEKLSDIEIYTPTLRSAATIKESFLKLSASKAILLPKIISFSELTDYTLPSAISKFERDFILTELVQKKDDIPANKAYALAQSLGELLDEFYYHQIPLTDLDKIVPDEFAQHWQKSLEFLEIITTYWPQICHEAGVIDIADYQSRVLRGLIQKWTDNPPTHPIYAVGFTGGFKALNDFLKTISVMKNGHLILSNVIPTNLDDINELHPYFNVNKLCNINEIHPLSSAHTERLKFLLTALLPATNTSQWMTESFSTDVLKYTEMIECEDQNTESFIIACRLREVLEDENKTASLVTTDRNLARRVINQMRRWNIELNDSAGTPLIKSEAGIFLNLLGKYALSGQSFDFLALLKNPLFTDHKSFDEIRPLVNKAEKEARQNRKKIDFKLDTDLNPLRKLFSSPEKFQFSVFLNKHIETAINLATSSDKDGKQRLFGNQIGQQLWDVIDEVRKYCDKIPPLTGEDYLLFLQKVLNQNSFRVSYKTFNRIRILGPIESRLYRSDLMIIASCVEGNFPQNIEAGFWLSRPMRKDLGLPLPEEKIGILANDFIHLMMANEVIITWSNKIDNSPTILSRWIQKIMALAEVQNIPIKKTNDELYFQFFKMDTLSPSSRPIAYVKGVDTPKQYSISDIKLLSTDPYGFYAKKILRLEKIPPMDEDIGAKEFGNAIHNTLKKYFETYSYDNNVDVIVELGKNELLKQGFNENNIFFWEEKLKKIAEFVIKTQSQIQTKPIFLEASETMPIQLENEQIFILGRSDRIDCLGKDITIIDYKTGNAPTKSSVNNLIENQLSIEGLIWLHNHPDTQIKDLQYWQLKGGNDNNKVISVISDELLNKASDFLYYILSYFNQELNCFPAWPDSKKIKNAYTDYKLLERISEWSDCDE